MEVQVFVAERDRVLVCDLEGERLDGVLWLKCCLSNLSTFSSPIYWEENKEIMDYTRVVFGEEKKNNSWSSFFSTMFCLLFLEDENDGSMLLSAIRSCITRTSIVLMLSIIR